MENATALESAPDSPSESQEPKFLHPATAGFWKRAQRYNEVFGMRYPGSVFHNDDGRIITATWYTGNDYRNRSRLYGAYPPQYLPRMMALFSDISDMRVLHLFSGSVPDRPFVQRFDVSPEFHPTMQGDAERLSEYYGTGQFELVFADPPYSAEDAKRYGTKMPNVRTVLHECAKVVDRGGYLMWLSTNWPMFSKKDWNLVGHVSIARSVMHRDRVARVFRRPL